jgi:hypothetical protein
VKRVPTGSQSALPMFERNGFTLDPSTCVPFQEDIGKGVLVYQRLPAPFRDEQWNFDLTPSAARRSRLDGSNAHLL